MSASTGDLSLCLKEKMKRKKERDLILIFQMISPLEYFISIINTMIILIIKYDFYLIVLIFFFFWETNLNQIV